MSFFVNFSQRLGGRIWTHTVGSKDNQLKVELGAQWAHGVIGNPTLAHGLEIDLSPVLHSEFFL